MNVSKKHKAIIHRVLKVEHLTIAQKLNFIRIDDNDINHQLLYESIGMLDELSREDDELAKKIIISVSAILWTYKEKDWKGLKEFLILILSRIGFSPSSIMVDSNYSFEDCQYSGLSSFVNELTITAHQLNNEVSVGDNNFLVTDFQKNVWDKLSSVKLLGISAPTSAGKSFIILLKTIDTILNIGGNVIYIVPTLSLVSQVSADFNEYLKRFGISNYRVTTAFNSKESNSNKIYVLTQERALSAFSQIDKPFQNIQVLVIDEIQNIERVANENDQRAKTLYDTLIEFRFALKPEMTIISGPRVEGLKQLGAEVFKEKSIDEEKTLSSPVASFTYAISKRGKKYYFNQYSDIEDKPNSIQIENSKLIKGYGLSTYREDFLKYLNQFILNLGTDSRNIIFSPTTNQARKTAVRLSSFSSNSPSNSKIDSLIKYLKETVHEEYAMCNTIPKGFLYHHGKTPSHVRYVVERAIRDKLVPNVVCTTTLMQGVNLPAQNVIMRNPYLAIRARDGFKPKLTNYEIANLRGRAGRLLKDFIGRTFVLEEGAFEKEGEQTELFPEAVKEIRAGYGEKFDDFKEETIYGLKNNETPSEKNKEYSYLMTHVRQTILRHKETSGRRLSAVGIEITDSNLAEISMNLNELEVPENVCFKNRYWDPLDLERLFRKSEDFYLPTSVNQYGIEYELEAILQRLYIEFPIYYQRYLDLSPKILLSVCISTKEWMIEKTLKRILSSTYFNNSDKVERKISLLKNKISYGLPLLLKPLYDIKYPESSFLHFIEMGAFRPITRKLIEINIPRETAIYLRNNYFAFENTVPEENILNRLKNITGELDYWRRIQVEQLV